MIYCVNGNEALKKRHLVTSRGTGESHWSAEYIGPRDTSKETSMAPHALVTDMSPNEIILPHFHGMAQFQIFSGGSGKMGRDDVRPLVVQFKDHHTAYGPVVAGPQGLTFFAMRMHTFESGPIYMSKPGYREKLKPSPRRNLLSAPLVLSTAPVLASRSDIAREAAFAETYADGLSAELVRMGAGAALTGPDPAAAGGHYLFVVNGCLEYAGNTYPQWSMIAVETTDKPVEFKAGTDGLEVLILQFPRETV